VNNLPDGAVEMIVNPGDRRGRVETLPFGCGSV
jgi:hypothetical protein